MKLNCKPWATTKQLSWYLGMYGRRSIHEKRLETLLIQNGMPRDGSAREVGHELSFEDQKSMSSIVDYVCQWHGPEPFSKWLGENAVDSLGAEPHSSQRREIALVHNDSSRLIGPYRKPKNTMPA